MPWQHGREGHNPGNRRWKSREVCEPSHAQGPVTLCAAALLSSVLGSPPRALCCPVCTWVPSPSPAVSTALGCLHCIDSVPLGRSETVSGAAWSWPGVVSLVPEAQQAGPRGPAGWPHCETSPGPSRRPQNELIFNRFLRSMCESSHVGPLRTFFVLLLLALAEAGREQLPGGSAPIRSGVRVPASAPLRCLCAICLWEES